jgi:hypothetical protein
MAAKSKKKVTKGKKSSTKTQDLTIHFMPYSEISQDDSLSRIKKIMGLVLDNKIIILQGKLRPDEEVRLIENSMTLIGNIDGFQGIDMATISGDDTNAGMFDKMKRGIARVLVGEQDKITIIGPATVVKEMKKNPRKIELLLQRR